jgi:hypothetical protein
MSDFVVVADPAVIEEPLLRSLKTYWDGQRQGRPMPRRAEIDVLELKPLIGSLFLLDVLDGGRDFRFRLLGTELTARFGRDITGQTFSEAYRTADGTTSRWLRGVYARAAKEAVPIWSRAPLRQVGRDFWVGTALHLPLSDDGATVNKIIGATVFGSSGA